MLIRMCRAADTRSRPLLLPQYVATFSLSSGVSIVPVADTAGGCIPNNQARMASRKARTGDSACAPMWRQLCGKGQRLYRWRGVVRDRAQ